MNKPLSLSILITYFREKELVRRCLDSLLPQLTGQFEILIHDDASPEPASEYLPQHPQLKVFRSEKNLGPSHGRNYLMTRAKGEYLHLHDADDWFGPQWYSKVSQEIETHNPDVLFTEVESFRHGRLVQSGVIGLERIKNGTELVPFALNHALLIPSATYRASFVHRLGGFRENLWQSEDFEFHARLAMAEPKFRIITESLVGIDIRGESRSQNQLEVWRCRLSALRLLFLDLSPHYYGPFIEALSSVGSRLYQLGDADSAGEAYGLATQLGTPQYLGRSLSFRILAKTLGPSRAEWIGKQYRSLLPDALRQFLRDQSRPVSEEQTPTSPIRKAS